MSVEVGPALLLRVLPLTVLWAFTLACSGASEQDVPDSAATFTADWELDIEAKTGWPLISPRHGWTTSMFQTNVSEYNGAFFVRRQFTSRDDDIEVIWDQFDQPEGWMPPEGSERTDAGSRTVFVDPRGGVMTVTSTLPDGRVVVGGASGAPRGALLDFISALE